MSDAEYMICVREAGEGGTFSNRPGPVLYLRFPGNRNPKPGDEIDVNQWIAEVVARSGRREAVKDPAYAVPDGDIIVFIHGFNNSQAEVMARHRQLQIDLNARGFKGIVISFDWPCGQSVFNYLEDRSLAVKTALLLVSDCITKFAEQQRQGCDVNVHLLAHSTGAHVVREAFSQADDNQTIGRQNWMVSQVAFIAADVSSGSMSASDARTKSLYLHCARLTNYYNGHDAVLQVSNGKRLGLAPRAGRKGIPHDSPDKAVDVDCTEYFMARKEGDFPVLGAYSHSWFIGDPVWSKDFYLTIMGKIDRNYFPTRILIADSDTILGGG
jgi:pimeloyl-ACP methyl ester carboxylesterase